MSGGKGYGLCRAEAFPGNAFRGVLFQRVAFAQPLCGRGIRRHAPVAAGRERDASHLGTVGQGRTLELLGKEAAEEYPEPLDHGSTVVASVEGVHGQKEYLRGRETLSHEVVEKVVVEQRAPNQVPFVTVNAKFFKKFFQL